ncbi:MAG: zf-TFIIB domain-containing protein [Deltaproteobacteria bacterium]|nr:zf-TFIIB domain-containing protein [Deltaproteobacteria bacterium]
MPTQKPHEAEEEYFAKIEAEKKSKLAQKHRSALQTREMEQLKETHEMHCPSCGMKLDNIVFKGFSVDKCFHCGGAFLSKEAFQRLCGEDTGFLEKIVEIFQFK